MKGDIVYIIEQMGAIFMRKQWIVALSNSIIGFIIAYRFIMITAIEGIYVIFIASIITFIVNKFIEIILIGNRYDYKHNLIVICFPPLIWSVIIIFYWYFFDLKRGVFLAGISILLMIFPIMVFLLNSIYVTIATIVNRLRVRR